MADKQNKPPTRASGEWAAGKRVRGDALAVHPGRLALERLCHALDLLAMLARRRIPVRLLVVGTYRPVEVIVQGHHPVLLDWHADTLVQRCRGWR